MVLIFAVFAKIRENLYREKSNFLETAKVNTKKN